MASKLMAPHSPILGSHGVGAGPVNAAKSAIKSFFFAPEDSANLHHARVWLCKVEPGEGIKKLGEEPIGIVKIPKSMNSIKNEVWVKHDNEWISSHQENEFFVRAYPITEVEYESDIAFGLFPILPITRRPIRTWAKQPENKRKVFRTNLLIAAAFSLPMASFCTHMMDSPGDFWAWTGVILFFHAIGSIIWMLRRVDKLTKNR